MTPMFQIRELNFDKDYEQLLSLWKTIEIGMHVGPSDTPDEIKKKLQRDPDLFLIAERDGQLIGSIIGGFDGRRGMIYHLAVQREYRRLGIGQALLTEVERRLRDKGCIRCLLLVEEDNQSAMQFYEERGWQPVPEDRVFRKNLT